MRAILGTFRLIGLAAVLVFLQPTVSAVEYVPEWRPPFDKRHPWKIVQEFHAPSHPRDRGHRGIDLVAPLGTPIYSVGHGVVHFSGVIAGKPTLSINHGMHPKLAAQPIRSTYEPVSTHLKIGEAVSAGQFIGYTSTGNSHCSNKCLHLGIKIGKDSYKNPQLLWSRSSSLIPSARG